MGSLAAVGLRSCNNPVKLDPSCALQPRVAAALALSPPGPFPAPSSGSCPVVRTSRLSGCVRAAVANSPRGSHRPRYSRLVTSAVTRRFLWEHTWPTQGAHSGLGKCLVTNWGPIMQFSTAFGRTPLPARRCVEKRQSETQRALSADSRAADWQHGLPAGMAPTPALGTSVQQQAQKLIEEEERATPCSCLYLRQKAEHCHLGNRPQRQCAKP